MNGALLIYNFPPGSIIVMLGAPEDYTTSRPTHLKESWVVYKDLGGISSHAHDSSMLIMNYLLQMT